jgi:flagellar basal-body rod modification protein FlgD
MDINALSGIATQPAASSASTSALEADDFLQLLVAQLSNQDPLEPTSNEALLEQLSSIREIQLSTELTESLKALTGNQRFGAIGSLIGKHVTGQISGGGTEGTLVEGTVKSIRFDAEGRAMLELDSGARLPMEHLASVSDPSTAGQDMIGKLVRGIQAGGDKADLIEGIVTAVGKDDRGKVSLELDTGEMLGLGELIQAA